MKAVGKKIRFEVLKRDKFQCQYCGAKAPDVLLHVDHIHPVAEGGKNDLLNLVTACQGCNAGKGKRKLSDDSAVEKQRKQLEELQQRREQIDLMLRWQANLNNMNDDVLEQVGKRWDELCPGWQINKTGLGPLRLLVKKHSAQTVMEAMEVAASKYLEFDENGRATQDSVEVALKKVGGVCHVMAETASDPDTPEFYKIRALLKSRFGDTFKVLGIVPQLKRWRDGGVGVSVIRDLAASRQTYSMCAFEVSCDAAAIAATESDE